MIIVHFFISKIKLLGKKRFSDVYLCFLQEKLHDIGKVSITNLQIRALSKRFEICGSAAL